MRRPDDRDEIRSVIEAAFLHTLQQEGLVSSFGERIPPLGEGAPHWILPNAEVDPEREITRNAFVHYLRQNCRVASVERQLDSLRRGPHSPWTRVKREVQEALAEAEQLKNTGSPSAESQFRVLNGSQAEEELIESWFKTISDGEHVLRELTATAGAWDGHSTFFGSMMSDDGDEENRPFDWDCLFFRLTALGIDLYEFSGGKLRPD